jgi:hypothetical protein
MSREVHDVKTWRVVQNTGTIAEIESDTELSVVNRPEEMEVKTFMMWLLPGTDIDEETLKRLFMQWRG